MACSPSQKPQETPQDKLLFGIVTGGRSLGLLVCRLIQRQNYICQFQESGVVSILTFSVGRRVISAIQIGFGINPHSGIFRFGGHLS